MQKALRFLLLFLCKKDTLSLFLVKGKVNLQKVLVIKFIVEIGLQISVEKGQTC